MVLEWAYLISASACPIWAIAMPEAIELLETLTSGGIREQLLLIIHWNAPSPAIVSIYVIM